MESSEWQGKCHKIVTGRRQQLIAEGKIEARKPQGKGNARAAGGAGANTSQSPGKGKGGGRGRGRGKGAEGKQPFRGRAARQ